MNICVLSGSPSGENSITLQTVIYLQKLFPGDEWEVLHVGRKIKNYEKSFEDARAALETADMILFCYPVYTFLAPSQLQRFIELMKYETACGRLNVSGKMAVQITTSKHFYDITALRYVRENCDDLGLNYLGELSEDMSDLLSREGRKQARQFWKYTLWKAKRKIYEPAAAAEIIRPQLPEGGTADEAAGSAAPAGEEGEYIIGDPCQDTEVVIVTDLREDPLHPEECGKLKKMIDEFRAACRVSTKVADLAEYPFAGGCIGCFHCAAEGVCIYKDGFDTFLREEIQTAGAIVYAFTIRDHSMGARIKMYDDRQFCNGHRTVTMGKPTGYIVNGNLAKEENVRTLVTARADVGGNFLAGIAEDEQGIKDLAVNLEYAMRSGIQKPKTFYGVGGLKIFRDLIFQMQGFMRADHKFYKEHGFYDDYPQKHPGTIAFMYAVGAMNNNPKLKKKIGNKMTEGMLMPYKKVLQDVDKGKK